MLKKLNIGTSEIEQVEAFNALVDAVNELQKNATISKMEKVESPAENVQKWIRGDDDEAQRYGAVARGFKNLQDHKPNMVTDDPFGPHPNIYEQGRPADPYAEQRKWIGKLCKFWDDNCRITKHFGILTRIDETAIVRYEAGNGFWYCDCEPIKPTDSIIYKGGNNE